MKTIVALITTVLVSMPPVPIPAAPQCWDRYSQAQYQICRARPAPPFGVPGPVPGNGGAGGGLFGTINRVLGGLGL